MIPFSGLLRFSGLFVGDGPSPLNRDTTVLLLAIHLKVLGNNLLANGVAKSKNSAPK